MNDRKNTAFSRADILLPRDVDMAKWAVIACDQFTSEPEYWEAAAQIAGDAPSALKLVLPEAGLKADDVEERIAAINAEMDRYLEEGLFTEYRDSLFYLERTQSDGKLRRGIIGKIDLECYDYTPGSKSLIRATEGTVLERIPPRVRVRKNASLELPHVMLLIDDPAKTVIEPLIGHCSEVLYDFDLMLGGGHAKAYRLSESLAEGVMKALDALCAGAEDPLLFAVGDGNHSLATAKTCYEELKARVGAEAAAQSPARYALVEVVNLHDDALGFEPIHRVLFGVDVDDLAEAFLEYYPGSYIGRGEGHVVECFCEGREFCLTVPSPKAQLTAGTLQSFLDGYVERTGCGIDYVHGDGASKALGRQPGNLAMLLPPMLKSELFPTVVNDGVLPRKTFSMGHARDKRYYIEARRIK